MKSVKTSFSKTVHATKIEKDDLEYVESLLIKLNPTDLVIKLPGYELDSVRELQDLKEKMTISRIEYSMYKPEHVSVNIDKYGVRMYTSDGDNVAIKGVFYDIEQRLKSGVSHIASLFGGFLVYLGFTVLVSSLMIVATNQIRGIDYRVDRAIVIIAIFLVVAIIGVMIKRFTRFRINPYEKVDNFFVRHADNLILSAISLFLGGVITYFVTLLSK